MDMNGPFGRGKIKKRPTAEKDPAIGQIIHAIWSGKNRIRSNSKIIMDNFIMRWIKKISSCDMMNFYLDMMGLKKSRLNLRKRKTAGLPKQMQLVGSCSNFTIEKILSSNLTNTYFSWSLTRSQSNAMAR